MNEGFEGVSGRYREGLFSALSAGFFFVVVGAIFIITPNLFDKIVVFFKEWRLEPLSPSLKEIRFPAPAFPRTHQEVYSAVEQFCYVWSLFQVVILVLRFVARSPWSKKAETVSNFVFWLGAGFLTQTFLIETTRWFVFWSGIIMLIGVTLIIRAIILAAVPTRYLT